MAAVASPVARPFGCDPACMTPLPSGLSWLIVGGESGPGARPLDLIWAQTLVEQCRAASVAVFVKQLGTAGGKRHHDIETFPAELQVREYPAVAS